MYHLTSAMVAVYNFDGKMAGANADMLQTLTKPFTELIVQVKIDPTLLKCNSSLANLCTLRITKFVSFADACLNILLFVNHFSMKGTISSYNFLKLLLPVLQC